VTCLGLRPPASACVPASARFGLIGLEDGTADAEGRADQQPHQDAWQPHVLDDELLSGRAVPQQRGDDITGRHRVVAVADEHHRGGQRGSGEQQDDEGRTAVDPYGQPTGGPYRTHSTERDRTARKRTLGRSGCLLPGERGHSWAILLRRTRWMKTGPPTSAR
jgi:hypothetical protein